MQNRASLSIAIIGGGAAGLMAAITASKTGAKVHIYEQNKQPAKKILASGNGRCNISNTQVSYQDYYGSSAKFSEFALKNFTFKQLQNICKEMGLLLNILDDGRAYPLSNEAKSVALSFESYGKRCGAEFFNEHTITTIEKEKDGFYLHTASNRSQAYDKVLLCTGSEAAPQLGGSNLGYHLAESLGHSIVPTYPSLVQLHLKTPLAEKIAGVKVDAEVTVLINAKKEQSVKGDLLFTKYGISGFAVLDISQTASEALLNYQSVDVSLDLLPRFDRQSLSSQLFQMVQNLPDYPIETILSGLLPIKLSRVILQSCNIPVHTLANQINTKHCKQIASKIKDWRLEVTQTHGFKHAEVSGGGINTDEVDEKSMESKLCKGLYFAGEMLDIVGRRGGFNFHFAFASAYLAANSMSK